MRRFATLLMAGAPAVVVAPSTAAPAPPSGSCSSRRRPQRSGRCRTSVPMARPCRERCWCRRRVISRRLRRRMRTPRPDFSSLLSARRHLVQLGCSAAPATITSTADLKSVTAFGSGIARDNLGGTHEVSFDVAWAGVGPLETTVNGAGSKRKERAASDRAGDLRRRGHRRRGGQPSNPAGTVHPRRHREVAPSRRTRDRLDPSFRVRLRKKSGRPVDPRGPGLCVSQP